MKKMNHSGSPFGLAVLLLLLAGVVSCTDHFTELNTPPHQITAENVDAALLGQAFAYSQYEGMFGDGSPLQTSQSHYGDLFAQYFAQTAENFDSDQFLSLGRRPNNVWNWFYGNAASQLKFVEDYTAEEGMLVENAMAKVWRVHIYHRVTDYWGPVIYSQFGNGETSVSYDDQESIYMDFFKTLDEAVAVLKQNTGAKAFTAHDLVYDGDVSRWLEFANSLRLRLAMRIVYVKPEMAKAEAEKAIQDGVITDNAGNADLMVTPNSVNGYTIMTNWGEFRMSAAMQSTLEGYQDPRIHEYFDEAVVGGGYKGIRNGLPRTMKPGTLNQDHSDMDVKWKPVSTPGPPLPILHASEVSFLRAEGALRGWNMGGTAKEFYEEGIRLSMKLVTTASDGEIEDYINSTNTPVPLNDVWNTPAMTDIPVRFIGSSSTQDGNPEFEKALEQIITQKWIALYPNGWEAWSERRRTGYPVGYALISTLNPNLDVTDIFRRVQFTENEYANNSVAVEEAIKLIGGDTNDIRLWWDKKPIEWFPTPAGIIE